MSALNRTFLVREVEDEARSKLEGRRVTVAAEFKKTRFPGSPDFLIEPVKDADRETPEYQAWKAGRSHGTPIEKLIGKPLGPLGENVVTPEVIDELKAAGVTNVEHLAAIPESAKGVPLIHTMKRLAQDTLAAAKADEEAQTVARRDAESDALRAQVADLEAKIARMMAALEPKEPTAGVSNVPA
jgi:hypothetical protein